MSSITGTLPSIFECPKCGETIETSAETCRFCGSVVDKPLALHRAMILAKVNKACSDATYMRSCALALPVFLILRFVPFFTWLGSLGFTVLCVVIPIWALIWWSRYSDLESEDPDYTKSRRAVRTVGFLVSILLLLFVVLPFVIGIFIGVMRATRPTF